jgi:hypothetical protein
MNAVTEREIAAVANKALRITPKIVEGEIASEHYFTAAQGVAGAGQLMEGVPESLGLLTICVLVLRNGFTVLGKSACASPENFDLEIGTSLAREDAVRQIWPLMGYELKSWLTFGNQEEDIPA